MGIGLNSVKAERGRRRRRRRRRKGMERIRKAGGV
jgi:hypothetical protein